MKIGNNGLKINTGLVKMQHKSNMISTMLGGGNNLASLSSLMGGGSARTQAMSMMKQMDTFDRLSSLTSGDSGAYSPSSTKGTAREQAKEIMKEYEESRKAAEPSSDKSAETAEALTNGEKKLSDTAKDYLSDLRKQYADTDFIVTGEGDDEAKLAKASKKEFTVVMSGDEVEHMATDKEYAKEQLHSMETTWKMNERIAEQYGGGKASGSR